MTDVDNALQAGNDLMLTNMGSVPTEASTEREPDSKP